MNAEHYSQDLSLSDRSKPALSASGDDPADFAAKPRGMDLSPLVRLVQRNILLILGVTTATAAVVAYSALGGPRTYKGGFQVLVEPITSQAHLADPSAISRPLTQQPDVIDYPTLLQVLQSPELLSKIAADIQRRYPDVTPGSLTGDLLSKKLVISRLEFESQRLGSQLADPTKVINVTYKGTDPNKVDFILQELARGYLRYSLEERKTRIGGGVQFIEDQLPSLQRRVNDLESEMQALKQRYRITDPETEGAGLSKQLQDVQAQQLETQRNLAEQQALFSRLQAQLGLTPTEALAAASLSENTSYQSLVAELKKVQAQLAIKSARFSDRSPVVQGLQGQQRELEQLLNAEALKSLGLSGSGGSIDPRILSFQNALRLDLIKQMVAAANTAQQLQVRRQAVAQTQSFLNQKLQEYPVIVRQYTDLKQRLDIARATLNQFLTQRETLRIEAAQKEVPWEIVSAPGIVRDGRGNPVPSANIESKYLIAGLGACLLLGFAAALLKEKYRNVFYSTEDMESALRLPVLGVIPFKSGLNQTRNPLATSGLDDFSKAFSALYTNIRFLGSNAPVRSMVVGSAESGDGKTTVAINLALEAASMGQRVLLVDANLRTPSLHSLLGLANTAGLSELLSSKGQSTDVIQRYPAENNLFVLTAGQATAGSAKLLASNEMQHLMHQLQADFDLVIYDTAALSEVSDAHFLTANTNGVIMVAGVSKTKRTVLSQVLNELNKFRLPVLGVLPNHPGRNAVNSYGTPGQYGQTYTGKPTLLENLKILKPDQSSSTKQSG